MQNKPLVINIYGGPGIGKSTSALGLTYKLKLRHINAEYLSEYAKSLTHNDRLKTLKNQSYVTVKQLDKQYALMDKYEVVVTDTSILLGLIPEYAGFGNTPSFESWILECYNLFDNLNIYLERNLNIPYQETGRSQKKDASLMIDNQVKTLLDRLKLDYTTVCIDGERTVDLIESIVHKKLISRGCSF